MAHLLAPGGKPLIVLDLTRLGPGGYCTAALRRHGARVIKVEDPQLGDYGRDVRMIAAADEEAGMSEFFKLLSVGKESVALDLKDETGRGAFLRMVAHADVVVEGFRPGVMARLALDWPRLAAVNPRLVLASITAFGQDSPFSGQATHDVNVMGLSGLLTAIAAGRRAGSDADGIQLVGVQLGDAVAGLAGVTAVLGALFGREAGGEGSWVDVSMYDALLSLPTVEVAEYAEAGRVARPAEGVLDGAFASYNLYRTADDGWLAVGAFEEKFWRRFCELVGRPEWAAIGHDREVQDRLKAEVAAVVAGRPLSDWEGLFAAGDCCVTPVRSLSEALGDEHARRRGLWQGDDGIEQPPPFAFAAGFDLDPGGEAPTRGEQTAAVLEEMGVAPEDVGAILAANRDRARFSNSN